MPLRCHQNWLLFEFSLSLECNSAGVTSEVNCNFLLKFFDGLLFWNKLSLDSYIPNAIILFYSIHPYFKNKLDPLFLGEGKSTDQKMMYLFYLALHVLQLTLCTPPLWTDLVKILTTRSSYSSFFSTWCTDFKNVIFEKIHWAPSEVAEVAEVKRPRNPKRRKF